MSETISETLKEEINDHPCIRDMRQLSAPCKDYADTASRFREEMDRDIITFREDHHKNLLAEMRKAEHQVHTLIKMMEKWGGYITKFHLFWMVAADLHECIKRVINNLEHYPSFLSLEEIFDEDDNEEYCHYLAWIEERERMLRYDLEQMLFSFRVFTPWLAEWECDYPQIFLLPADAYRPTKPAPVCTEER